MNDVTATALPLLPRRKSNDHKGTFGHALLIGGSRGMAGSIALAGKAALRSGAGLVTLAVPESIQHVVASFEPSYMTHGLLESTGSILGVQTSAIEKLSQKATAIGIGPGLGQLGTSQFVRSLFETLTTPMVVDADGLNALAHHRTALSHPAGPRVLTPHPGEFARLTDGDKPFSKEDRIESAAKLANNDNTEQSVVVLKGNETIVTDGDRYAVNATGNPGMATGGTGDVLTGIIVAMICQGLSTFDAARLAVHVHGLAGDLAAERLGQISLIASDVLEYLAAALMQLEQTKS